MKNFKVIIFLLFVSFTSKFFAQDIAYNDVKINLTKEKKSNATFKKSLEDGKYKYDNSRSEVIVEIKGNSYTEYYPNNEFIKAEIHWLSTDEYILIIKEIKKPNLPFKKGDVFNTKILKNRGNRYYYSSGYQDRNWTGKFLKIDDK